MLSSVVRRQSGGLFASLAPYLRTAAASSRGFAAAAAEEQVRSFFFDLVEDFFFSMASTETNRANSSAVSFGPFRFYDAKENMSAFICLLPTR